MAEPGDVANVTLSLVSHTNVGKTTLARTLLRRDVGEVRDEAHVTLESTPHPMLDSPAGDRLVLWDTPGFGDSLRLAKRLEREASPLGWFLNEVWDRYRHRAWWSSQRALRTVLDQADAVLYLVNAAEDPQDATYLDAELRVLALLRKPVVVLLNQTGPARDAALERAEVERWTERLGSRPGVHDVLALDAFTRCWVREARLLDAVAKAVPERSGALVRLRAAWAAAQVSIWRDAIATLAARLARAATDVEPIPDGAWTDRLRGIGQALGWRGDGPAPAREQAMRALAQRLEGDLRAGIDEVVRLHGLEGRAAEQVIERLAGHYKVREPVPEGKAALIGGLVTGALTGLKADLATGGLTLGGGMLAGGLIGALGAAGLARGYNLVRGQDSPAVGWADTVLDDLFRTALLTYLAIAHHGRGRGEWSSGPLPAALVEAADAAFAEQRPGLQDLWSRRSGADAAALEPTLRNALTDGTRAALLRLYPEAADLLRDA